jgi:hypothetical protein
MALSNKKIIVGGWPAFAEQTGVNKKEPAETFDWIPSESDKAYYIDMCAALNAVEGAREWLKTYEFDEARDIYPYNSDIGSKLIMAMSKNHSGASASCILINYKNALNDWDTFVFNVKKYQGLKDFKRQQVPYEMVNSILSFCDSWLEADGVGKVAKDLEELIFTRCAMLALAGTVPEIRAILRPIQKDYEAIYAQEKHEYEEASHKQLMGCIKFLYEHPIRWFDTPKGCSLKPVHPTNITKRAMAEMEAKFPGYDKHIENVLVAMGSPRKPKLNSWAEEGRAEWDTFLKAQKVIA